MLFHGALAASGATFVGHYPWFFVVGVCHSKSQSQKGVAQRQMLHCRFPCSALKLPECIHIPFLTLLILQTAFRWGIVHRLVLTPSKVVTVQCIQQQQALVAIISEVMITDRKGLEK